MSAIDLKKLNRLVIPPPTSTIIGNDCVAPFKSGAIELVGGDDFVGVDGNVNIRNIDEFGEAINQSFPFQIHEHTYGYDFNLDIPALIEELKARGQFKVFGATGDIGPKGDQGDKGQDSILSGPAGLPGEQGLAPNCTLSIEPEPLLAQARPGLKKALTGVTVITDPEDDTKYFLQFDRQDIGIADNAATSFNVRQQKSTWVLAVASIAANPQQVFYIDIEPLLISAHEKFLTEVELLKKGYEDIVQFWVQTMSDLFDEQKDALCCALEFCMSKTKSTQLREHMENLAAAAIPNAKIVINPRDSGEAVEISNMGLSASLPDGEDLCDGGGFPPPPPPPPPPSPPPPPPPTPPPPTPPPPPPGGGGDEYDDGDLEPKNCTGGIDVCFIIDDTSSMGVAIGSVKESVEIIVEKIIEVSSSNYRLALIAFKDSDEIRTLVDFDNLNAAAFKEVISTLVASGGGDAPEAGAEAIIQSANLSWGTNARVAIHITDQITHRIGPSMVEAASIAAAKDITFGAVQVITFGDNPAIENELRDLARITSGVYARLDDGAVDSAILRIITDVCSLGGDGPSSPSVASPNVTGSKSELGTHGISWGGVGNAKICGNLRTVQATTNTSGYTKIFYAHRFPFDRNETEVPEGATITGISATIIQARSGSGTVRDRAVSFFKNPDDFTGGSTPSYGGSGYASPIVWPGMLGSAVYEMSAVDLLIFNSDVVRNQGFGIGISAELEVVVAPVIAHIDCVTITIDWTILSPSKSGSSVYSFKVSDPLKTLIIDPLVHSGVMRAVSADLPAGEYSAIISKMNAQIGDKHYAPIAIQYISDGKIKTAKFLDKGHFSSIIDARNAYEGLTTAFRHEGGRIHLYYNIFPSPDASGDIVISIVNTSGLASTKSVVNPESVKRVKETIITPPREITCRMTANKLNWYENGWKTGKCCGVVINVSGQDYIIVKRSIGDDESCGGGESEETPCISKFKDSIGHPAIAWPTFDGKSFAPIPESGAQFRYDKHLNSIISEMLEDGKYIHPKGNPSGVRHLTYQLMSIIFPVA